MVDYYEWDERRPVCLRAQCPLRGSACLWCSLCWPQICLCAHNSSHSHSSCHVSSGQSSWHTLLQNIASFFHVSKYLILPFCWNLCKGCRKFSPPHLIFLDGACPAATFIDTNCFEGFDFSFSSIVRKSLWDVHRCYVTEKSNRFKLSGETQWPFQIQEIAVQMID